MLIIHILFGANNNTVALGKLLTKCGFEYWDLGMDLEYKRRLGAELMRREDFLANVKRSRVENKGVELQCGGERKNAKELIDWERPETTAASALTNTSAASAATTASSKDVLENGNSSRLEENNLQTNECCQKESTPKSNRKRPHDEEVKGG